MLNGENRDHDSENATFLSTVERIKSAQKLITIATIAAPVSLLIGGVLLSSIALICGIIGMRRLRSINAKTAHEMNAIQPALRSARMTLIMCGIALALNAVSLAMMYPTYMEILQGETLTNLDSAGITTNDGGQESSIWG